MAKDSERNQARVYFIDQNLTFKEIAARLKVSEHTVGKWADVGDWKALRLAKQSSTDVLVKNYNELLGLLIEKRLKFERKTVKTDEEKAEHTSTIDEISKIAAAIDRIQKDGKLSLRTHIHCLEKFMKELQLKDVKLFQQVCPIQIQYLDQLAEELK
jgi:hypothetical protein